MKFKAIVYDTQNREPMETTVRCIFCNENGTPIRLQAHNGMNYNEFHIWNDNEPCKYNNYKESNE
jgi:hypothetical protein